MNYPVCPHCKKAIQWQPAGPATEDTSPAEWVTVKKCESLAEADAVRCQLQAAGIVVLIPDEMLMQASPVEGSSYGFTRVQVRSPQVDDAREVLALAKPEGAPKDEAEIARAALPLSNGMKCAAFLMGLFLCLGFGLFAIAKSGYARQGCERKERDLWHWFAGGAVFGVAAFFIFVMVTAMMA
ncbi:MAG TPA: hypothetical protein VGF13_07870 [Verrucomicrobiae bacterium]